MIEFNLYPSPRELRVFSAALILFSVLLGIALYRRIGLVLWAEGIVLALVVFGMTGLCRPSLVLPIYQVSHVVTFPIGWLVSHVILGVIFFLLITPLGVVLRLLGKDSMKRQFDRSAVSYWKKKTPERKQTDYFRQF